MNFDFIEGLLPKEINDLYEDEVKLSYCNTGYNSYYRRTCWWSTKSWCNNSGGHIGNDCHSYSCSGSATSYCNQYGKSYCDNNGNYSSIDGWGGMCNWM